MYYDERTDGLFESIKINLVEKKIKSRGCGEFN